MNRYILNSAVLTSFGTFTYHPFTVREAKTWLREGPFVSTIGYEETAVAATALFGVPISLNRIIMQMAVDDEALVFRLVFPTGTPRLDVKNKGKLDVDFIIKHCEIGFLFRVA